MLASKPQVQGLKICNRLRGGGRGEEQRQVHALRLGLDEQPPSPTWSEGQGHKPKIVHPKATTGIRSSEAVGKTGWVEKNGFVLKNFVEKLKCTLLLSNPQLLAARGCAEQVEGGGCDRKGRGKC